MNKEGSRQLDVKQDGCIFLYENVCEFSLSLCALAKMELVSSNCVSEQCNSVKQMIMLA